MSCAGQNHTNEQLNQKELSCTQFGVLLISGIKANEQWDRG